MVNLFMRVVKDTRNGAQENYGDGVNGNNDDEATVITTTPVA